MTSTSALVITDNEAPERFGRALAQAAKVCGPDTELVAITDRPQSVPVKLRRRVRLVRLRPSDFFGRLRNRPCSSSPASPWGAAPRARARAR